MHPFKWGWIGFVLWNGKVESGYQNKACECRLVDVGNLHPREVWERDVRCWEVGVKLAAGRQGKLCICKA